MPDLPPSDAAALRIDLLGRFRVSSGDRVVDEADWRLRKARTLVKLLALASHRRVHREVLLETLWPDLPPTAADNNLRFALHTARRTLGLGASGLGLRGEVVALDPPGGVSVDLDRFERAAAAARSSGDPSAYRAAIDSYGGALLPEDRYEEWCAARAEGAQRLYVALSIELAGLHETAGEWAPAAAALESALEAEPLHEGAHAALMRVYTLAGQRARALAQYERLSAALAAELGVGPDPATVALARAIRAGRIGSPSAEEEPRHNLPHPLTSLIGRESALEKAGRLLDTSPLVTLTGPGGVGKTRLALAVAHAELRRRPDGVFLVQLESIVDPHAVPHAVAAAVGVPEESGRDVTALLIRHLRDRAALLVLDNCEHLLDACARLAERLLGGCPGLRVLATSRERLRIGGESTMGVPPLAHPPESAELKPAGWERYAAVRLFVERARALEPAFAIDDAAAAAVGRICSRLDGLPLAIELAVARLPALSLDEIAARLDDRFELLASGSRTAEPRHQALRELVAWSYDLLATEERTVLARLAVFAGGWTLEAAEAVCGVGVGPLASLVDKSLVAAETWRAGDPERRYRLLETVRLYARERLAEHPDEEADARRRHAAHFLALAESAEAGLSGAEQAAWLQRLDREHDNLRVALRWAIDAGDVDTGPRLAASLWRYWLTRGQLSQGQEWLNAALDLSAGAAPNVRAKTLAAAGAMAHYLGDFDRAVAHHAEGLAVRRREGDARGIAASLNSLGCIATERADYPAARGLLELGLAVRREIGDGWGVGAGLHNLALVALAQGAADEAERLCRECLEVWRATGSPWAIAQGLANYGFAARSWGHFEAAERLLRESLEMRRELGDRRGIGFALYNLAAIARARGGLDAAEREYDRSLALLREAGDRHGVALVLDDMARLACVRSAHARAAALAAESMELFRSLGARASIATGLETRAAIAVATGDAVGTARLLGAARALREALGCPIPPADVAAVQATEATARDLLGDAAWRAAERDGRDGRLDDVIHGGLSEV